MNSETTFGFAALCAGILSGFERQKNYALALVENLSADDMVAQPIDGIVMNHPAWALSHLNAYMPVLMTMLGGGTPDDPIDHVHGRQSKPLPNPRDYMAKDELIPRYLALHDATAEAFISAEAVIFAKKTPIPRFVERFPTIASVTIQLMIKHEATHLGQISAWRRAGGRPMVTP